MLRYADMLLHSALQLHDEQSDKRKQVYRDAGEWSCRYDSYLFGERPFLLPQSAAGRLHYVSGLPSLCTSSNTPSTG